MHLQPQHSCCEAGSRGRRIASKQLAWTKWQGQKNRRSRLRTEWTVVRMGPRKLFSELHMCTGACVCCTHKSHLSIYTQRLWLGEGQGRGWQARSHTCPREWLQMQVRCVAEMCAAVLFVVCVIMCVCFVCVNMHVNVCCDVCVWRPGRKLTGVRSLLPSPVSGA